jgi:hypothetical protein
MKTKLGLRQTYKFKLVKWDGVPTPEQQALPKPETDKDCIEIREWNLGQPNTVTYRRKQEE